MENIIFEDNHLLIVGKKSTIPVQSDISGDKCLLDYSKEYIKKKTFNNCYENINRFIKTKTSKIYWPNWYWFDYVL